MVSYFSSCEFISALTMYWTYMEFDGTIISGVVCYTFGEGEYCMANGEIKSS